ncbi:uncharacterized protein KZ484_005502 [Pholidichthys leucotaenia]
MEWMKSCRTTDEDGAVLSLRQLCLLNIGDNMKEVWAKDYSQNYMDHYSFRHIMGPFNLLTGELVEELTSLLCIRKQLSRAALHLLLVPHLKGLSLDRCPSLVTSSLCEHIAARCQGLLRLQLSGAQQLSPKVLSETLHCLPALRSLSLAGTPCDKSVINTVAQCCRLLQHLDVSRCLLLSPAALLPLGGGAFCSSSSSSSLLPESQLSPSSSLSHSSSTFSPVLPPLPLCSLLAQDIGLGEQEGDSVVAAAYLLLLLPLLERIAMEGLGQACSLIEQKDLSQTDEFSVREGVPRLEEVRRERMHKQDSWMKKRMNLTSDKEQDHCSENEEAVTDDKPSCFQSQLGGGDSLCQLDLILQLKDVKGITCDSLKSVCRLCPGISSISLHINRLEQSAEGNKEFAEAFQTFSGLKSVSVNFSGQLSHLLPALQAAGSSLISLTLEGIQSGQSNILLQVIRSCSRLRDLYIYAEPPISIIHHDPDEEDDQNPPQLADLRGLTLSFSYEHIQMKPAMTWMSLMRVLKCLLAGSPLLEKLSLASLPCPLNTVLNDVLDGQRDPTGSPTVPLGKVRHIDLQRTDVTVKTVKHIMERSKRLKSVDLSSCWEISHKMWQECKKSRHDVDVVWV